MKPDCERFDALMTSGAPLSEADAPFVKEHAASCESCRELENALASVAFRPQDDTHFPMDDLSARRMVNAVLEQAAKEEHETEARPERVRRLMLVAAGLLLIAGAGWWLSRSVAAPSTPMPIARVDPTKTPEPSNGTPKLPTTDSMKTPAVEPTLTPNQPQTPEGPAVLAAQIRLVSGPREREPGAQLSEGAVLRTKAALGITVGAQAWVRAAPGTEWTFTSLKDHDLAFELRAGHLDVHVPHGQGIKLRIQTPQGRVAVVGTAFSVNVAKKQTRVVVAEGAVHVDARGQSFQVGAGFGLSLTRGQPGRATAAELSSIRESLAQESVVTDGDGQLSVTAGNNVRVDNISFGRSPVAMKLSSGKHQVSREGARGRTEQTTVEIGDREVLVDESTGKPSPKRDAPTPKNAPPQKVTTIEPPELPVTTASVEQLMQLAQKARANKDWRGAARAYSEIIDQYGGTAAADVAKLSLGQLQLDQLGEPQQGLSMCQQYAERNPNGALRAQAELCQIRAFERLGQHDKEAQAIESFLKRWPDDFNAARFSTSAPLQLWRHTMELFKTCWRPAEAVAGLATRRAGFDAVLDGVRALSVLAVFWHHVVFQYLGFAQPSGAPEISSNGALRLAATGYLGVDAFFALSGFLIARQLLNEASVKGTISLRSFYLRRAFRILPLYVLLLVVTLHVWPHPERVITNLLLINNWWPTLSSVLPWSWSLAVEEQFYVVFPLVLLAALKLPKRFQLPAVGLGIVALTGWALSLALRAPGLQLPLDLVNPFAVSHGDFDYMRLSSRTDFRANGLLIGVATAFLVRHFSGVRAWWRTAVGVAGLAVLVVMHTVPTAQGFLTSTSHVAAAMFFTGTHFMYPLAIGAVIFASAESSGVGNMLAPLFANRFTALVAKLSFGIYLVHPIVIDALVKQPWAAEFSYAVIAVTTVAGLAITLLVTALLNVVLEAPFMKLRDVVLARQSTATFSSLARHVQSAVKHIIYRVIRAMPLSVQNRMVLRALRFNPNTLGDVVVKIADQEWEHDAAARLTFDAYVGKKLVPESGVGIRLTPFLMLPTTVKFVAVQDGEVIATMSLICDSKLGLPMESVFPRELDGLRAQKRKLAEVGALAVKKGHRGVGVAMMLYKAMWKTATELLGVDDLVIAVHPQAEAMYVAPFLFERLTTEVRHYPGLEESALAIGLRANLQTFPTVVARAFKGCSKRMFNSARFFLVEQQSQIQLPKHASALEGIRAVQRLATVRLAVLRPDTLMGMKDDQFDVLIDSFRTAPTPPSNRRQHWNRGSPSPLLTSNRPGVA